MARRKRLRVLLAGEGGELAQALREAGHAVALGGDALAALDAAESGALDVAVIDLEGFRELINAMGGVTMTIDQNVKSEHLRPDGSPRPRLSRCADNSCEHPYYGPQKQYKVGTYHLQGWEALDYVRQRYGLPRSDYDRQRHQQQFIKAMAKQALSKDVITNPAKLDKVLKAAGSALIGPEEDVLGSFENVTGSRFADAIRATSASNDIRSGNGADSVRAGAGEDDVRGGGGNDRLRGGDGDDDLFGQGGKDRLFGGPGVDFCNGGPGKDRLRGCE